MILGREADQGGLDHYLKSRMDLYQIQMALWDSDEFRNRFKQTAYEPTPLDNKLPIFIVNLERRPDRKQLIESRLANLGIKNYEIIKAVDGEQLPEDLSELYNKDISLELQRELKRSEIACSLSHVEIARKIVNDNLEYAIILEDDAELTLELKQFIKDFDLESDKFDFLILGSFSSNEFFNGKLKTKQSPYRLIEKRSITYLGDTQFSIGSTTIHNSHYPTQVLDFVNGTHGYMLSNAGAKKLLELNYPVVVQADNVWNYFYEQCKTLFTNPILVHRQFEDSDIHTEREEFNDNFDNYSNNFKKRKYHDDFGT
jgi:glycosyl transferase family 25